MAIFVVALVSQVADFTSEAPLRLILSHRTIQSLLLPFPELLRFSILWMMLAGMDPLTC
jgi:hypothetical protein